MHLASTVQKIIIKMYSEFYILKSGCREVLRGICMYVRVPISFKPLMPDAYFLFDFE